jgi:hypothetical protein
VVSIFAQLSGELVGNSDLLRAGGSGVRTLVDEIFPDRSTHALDLPSHPVRWIPGFFAEVKRPGRGPDNLPPYSARGRESELYRCPFPSVTAGPLC